ncbi:hypothetical protein E4U41_003793, partial [Claviceps citrina]
YAAAPDHGRRPPTSTPAGSARPLGARRLRQMHPVAVVVAVVVLVVLVVLDPPPQTRPLLLGAAPPAAQLPGPRASHHDGASRHGRRRERHGAGESLPSRHVPRSPLHAPRSTPDTLPARPAQL